MKWLAKMIESVSVEIEELVMDASQMKDKQRCTCNEDNNIFNLQITQGSNLVLKTCYL